MQIEKNIGEQDNAHHKHQQSITKSPTPMLPGQTHNRADVDRFIAETAIHHGNKHCKGYAPGEHRQIEQKSQKIKQDQFAKMIII